jgi:hypothetical protein
MRTRFVATLATAAMLTLGLPGVAGATCTEVIDDAGCVENAVCAAVGLVVKGGVDCIEEPPVRGAALGSAPQPTTATGCDERGTGTA